MQAVNRRILYIAAPAIVSNITTPILGLVDVAVVGHFGSAAYIGAIAVGSTMFNMLYWLFGFIRMGTAGITSQAYGAADAHNVSVALRRALLIAFIFGLAMIALSHSLGRIILEYIDSDGVSSEEALEYFYICIWGAPAVLGTYGLNGWLLGQQDTRIPMWVAIFTNIANIAISLSLVFGADMKMQGVAIGTMSAQWLGFAAALIAGLVRYKPVRVGLRAVVNGPGLGRMFRINTDIFLRTVCLVAVTTWFTHAGAACGVEILAANALLLQLFMFFSFLTDGFSFAGEALSGSFLGARDYNSLRVTVTYMRRWGLGIAILFTLVYVAGGHGILRLLTDDAQVVSTAARYLPWAVCIPLCSVFSFIYDGIFIGMTHTRRMLAAMFVAMLSFFAVYYATKTPMGNNGLWLAFLTYLTVRSLMMHLLLKLS